MTSLGHNKLTGKKCFDNFEKQRKELMKGICFVTPALMRSLAKVTPAK